jgi:pimeloyl-ACP methyl ester carboxylesterase
VRATATFVGVVLLLAGCSERRDQADQEHRTKSVELLDRRCDLPPEVGTVDCWTLVVPADRSDPRAGEVRLPVVALRATESNTGGAVVIPQGGPGYSGTATVTSFASSPLRERHDLILYDQRGTGGAEPSLNCPEREEAFVAGLAVAEPPGVEVNRLVEAMAACRQRLRSEGIDLNLFNTPINAADLRDLRQALGLRSWNVLGVSYGARLAIELTRVDGDAIRALILDSVYLPGRGGRARSLELARNALERLTTACREDPGCRAAHPDLRAELDALIAAADAAPITAQTSLDDGTRIDLALSGADLLGGLYNALYDHTLIPLLPSIIGNLARGDTSVIGEIGRRAIPFVNSISEGVYYAVDCADNKPLQSVADATAVEDAGPLWLIVALTPDCTQWNVESVKRSFAELPRLTMPVLAMAGSLDPVTPPWDTKAAADAATGPSTYVEFDGFGHGVWDADDCAWSITSAFLTSPTTAPDTTCADRRRFAFSS